MTRQAARHIFTEIFEWLVAVGIFALLFWLFIWNGGI